MKKLSAKTLLLAQTDSGVILEIQISGRVEPQQGGIAPFIEPILLDAQVAGIVFNLTELYYVSWDDIGIHGIISATKGFTRPCCIFSVGRNRENLGLFLRVSKLADLMGGQVFTDSGQAVAFIRESIKKGSS